MKGKIKHKRVPSILFLEVLRLVAKSEKRRRKEKLSFIPI
jgi:hypothetical protein